MKLLVSYKPLARFARCFWHFLEHSDRSKHNTASTMRSARTLRRCLTTKSTTKDWRAVAEREAKKAGTSLEALTSTTKESLEIQSCYFGNDDEAAPGVFPYCLLYTSPSPRDATLSRMPSSA